LVNQRVEEKNARSEAMSEAVSAALSVTDPKLTKEHRPLHSVSVGHGGGGSNDGDPLAMLLTEPQHFNDSPPCGDDNDDGANDGSGTVAYQPYVSPRNPSVSATMATTAIHCPPPPPPPRPAFLTLDETHEPVCLPAAALAVGPTVLPPPLLPRSALTYESDPFEAMTSDDDDDF
jgi:hypothetical protein